MYMDDRTLAVFSLLADHVRSPLLSHLRADGSLANIAREIVTRLDPKSAVYDLNAFQAICCPSVVHAQLRFNLLLDDWTNSSPSFVFRLPQVTNWIGILCKA